MEKIHTGSLQCFAQPFVEVCALGSNIEQVARALHSVENNSSYRPIQRAFVKSGLKGNIFIKKIKIVFEIVNSYWSIWGKMFATGGFQMCKFGIFSFLVLARITKRHIGVRERDPSGI